MLKTVSALVHTIKRKVFEEDDPDSRFEEDDPDEYNYVEEENHDHKNCSPLYYCGSVHCLIRDIGVDDDVDRFVEKLERPVDPPGQISWTFPIISLKTFILYRSVKCLTAVVNHIDFTEVHYDSGLSPLYFATLASCPQLVELFLKHGAPTDVRSQYSSRGRYQTLPLNYSLHLLSNYLIHFKILTPEQSVYKLLSILCLPQLRSKLEIVRLLAWETNELGEEIYYYAKHGRLVELAVLLWVAREKVTSVSLVKKSSLSQNDNDSSSLDHCMTLREFIISELAQLSALQVKLEINGENDKLSSCCKEKQNLMMSALLLLEIFERAGKTIESYLHNQTQIPQEQVSRVLKEAGFCLEDKDTDMGHVESFSWPGFLDTGDVSVVGKNAEQSNQLGSSLAFGNYASWRKNPIFQSQRFIRMKYKKTDFKPDASLEKDLELLSQNVNLTDWTSEKSVSVLLYELRSPNLRNLRETIRSHLDKQEEIGELVCYYAREISVVKVATVLMLAWKNLMAVDSVDFTSGVDCGRSKIRQCLTSEIGKLIDKEMQQLGKSYIDKENISSKISTDKEKMVFALRLLEVFEMAGDNLDQFIQSGQYRELKIEDYAQMACLLSIPISSLNPKGIPSKCEKCGGVNFSKGGGEGPSEGLDDYAYKGTNIGEKQITFSLKETPLNGTIPWNKGMSASSQFGWGSRPIHTLSISRASFHVVPSLPVRTDVYQPTKKLEARVLRFSSCRKWVSIAGSLSRALKHV